MINKKKLAVIYWSLGIGGISTSIIDINKKLLQNGNISTHFFFKRRGRKLNSLHSSNLSFFSENTYEGQKVGFFFWLVKELILLRPTHLLVFFNRFGLIGIIYRLISKYLMRINILVVMVQSTHTSYYLRQFERGYWKMLSTLIFQVVDKIIVHTNVAKKDLVENFSVNPDKIPVVSNWVKQMKSKKLTKKYDCIFVGRLSPEKGIDTLIETVKYCVNKKKDFTLVIVGDGDLRDWLTSEIKKENLSKHVIYLGYKSNPQNYIKKSKLLLLPSRNEGLPMVILESYAVGVPVVVTPFLGADEVVEHNKTGLISSRAAYPRAVCTLLGQNRKITKLGKGSLVKARRDYSMKNLDKFINEIFVN